MPVRLAAAGAALLLVLAACGGGPAATGAGAGPTSGTVQTPGSAAGGSAAPATGGTAIDLSSIDVCALVGTGTAEALTGEKDFDADGSSSAHSAKCFFGVPRPGVPQYLEVTVERRTASLQGFQISPNGQACPGTAVSGVGAEAIGGVCSGSQKKVWLAAMDQGIMVLVLVNEPKGALSPANLGAAVNAVLAGLG